MTATAYAPHWINFDAPTGTRTAGDTTIPAGATLVAVTLGPNSTTSQAPLFGWFSVGVPGTWDLGLQYGTMRLGLDGSNPGTIEDVVWTGSLPLPNQPGILVRFAVQNDTGATASMRGTVVYVL